MIRLPPTYYAGVANNASPFGSTGSTASLREHYFFTHDRLPIVHFVFRLYPKGHRFECTNWCVNRPTSCRLSFYGSGFAHYGAAVIRDVFRKSIARQAVKRRICGRCHFISAPAARVMEGDDPAPLLAGTWFAVMRGEETARLATEDFNMDECEILEFQGELDGRAYSCLYRRTYSERLHCYELAMAPGSLRWADNDR